MPWLAGLSLFLTLLVFALWVYAGLFIKKLRELPLPEAGAPLPRVSLIAPARNEERNIEQAVRSLLKLDYPDLQITLVNDRSTDSTGEILDRLAAEFPQLNVVHLTDLPAGWLGKNHAMQYGAERSTGEWILFTDADVIFEPTTLKRAIRYATETEVDHLAGAPVAQMPSWILKCFVVTFSMNFLLFVRAWGIRNPNSTAHVGIGAFNLIRREVFEKIEGFHPIKMRPDDDLKLGKLVKLRGFRQDLVTGGDGMIVVHWYGSLWEMVRGLEKNMYAAIDYNLFAAVFISGSMVLLNIWPYFAVFHTIGTARWLYIADVIALTLLIASSARESKNPYTCALGFPLAVALFIYIQWRSIFLTYWKNGIQWRDTHYSLAELRANRI
ncbi:MAG: glycosyltransferase family 2 protein [Planctomycetales bacterium]|nr:glycosyltransferase family 2 protein [Planctomycetales bacterium]